MVKEGSFPPLGDWAEGIREFAATCDRKAEKYCQEVHREACARGRKADARLRTVVQRSNLAWQEIRPGVGRAAEELRQAFQRARERFKEGQDPEPRT